MTLLPGFLNLNDEVAILRIACGLFFIPHVVGKFTAPAAVQFFINAGFRPAKLWMYLAGVIEIVLALCLVLGWQTRIVAPLAAIHLIVAAVAVYRLTGKWLWNIGGCEFPVFWALACGVVALHG